MVGHALVDLLHLEFALVQCVGQVLGDVQHLERQRRAMDVGALPAQGRVGVAAFRENDSLGADLDGCVDDLLRLIFLKTILPLLSHTNVLSQPFEVT